MNRIYLSSPHMGGNEQTYVNEAFESNWIAPLGPNLNAFEEAICQYTGIQHAAALSSGTGAIHLALDILGVRKDDEVLCQSFTFSASANPITYVGAHPVFIDSEGETWNMDPDLLEQVIRERTKAGKKPAAVIVVHLYGMPARMEAIMELCQKHDVPVIEDAAEALGSSMNGKIAGTFGDIGILSFNGNKIITTSGGGALISNKKEYVDKARFLATQARDAASHYQHSHIGYNYRLSNVLAGIGRGQMEVLSERIKQRREIYNFYRELLTDYPGISFLDEPVGYFSNRWLTTVLIDPEKAGFSREDLRLRLEEDNIESRPLWKPMHQQPIFRDCRSYLNGVSDGLFEQGLCLPSGSNMTKNELDRIENKIKQMRE